MTTEYREMQIADYDNVIALWKASEGVGLGANDDPEGIARFLSSNLGLSYVVFEDGQLVGAVLCSQDSRRGFISHLAVRTSHRRLGIGEKLVEKCFDGLRKVGIHKCHIFVFQNNLNARAFWERTGWILRDDLIVMSKYVK